MADNIMPNNPNGLPAGDPMAARYYQLDERVTNLRTSVSHLESQMQNGFQGVHSQLSNLTEQFRQGQKTQWPVIWAAAGVVFTVLGGIGAILYVPMQGDIEKLETLSVQRQEYDAQQLRGAETRMRFENAISVLTERMVPKDTLALLTEEYSEFKTRTHEEIVALGEKGVTRAEWMERNRARDNEVGELGRRIDDVRQTLGAVYGTRDIILDLKKEIDWLRQRMLPDNFRTGATSLP